MREELLRELLQLFPNKLLKDFSKKMTYENKKKIEAELEEEIPKGMSLKQFLIKNYDFIDGTSILFDYEVIKIISDRYEGRGNYRRKIFEKTEGVTKQRIEQKLKKTLEKK